MLLSVRSGRLGAGLAAMSCALLDILSHNVSRPFMKGSIQMTIQIHLLISS